MIALWHTEEQDIVRLSKRNCVTLPTEYYRQMTKTALLTRPAYGSVYYSAVQLRKLRSEHTLWLHFIAKPTSFIFVNYAQQYRNTSCSINSFHSSESHKIHETLIYHTGHQQTIAMASLFSLTQRMHLWGLTYVTRVMFSAPSGAFYNVITTCFRSLVSSGSLNPVCCVVSMSVLLS